MIYNRLLSVSDIVSIIFSAMLVEVGAEILLTKVQGQRFWCAVSHHYAVIALTDDDPNRLLSRHRTRARPREKL